MYAVNLQARSSHRSSRLVRDHVRFQAFLSVVVFIQLFPKEGRSELCDRMPCKVKIPSETEASRMSAHLDLEDINFLKQENIADFEIRKTVGIELQLTLVS